MERQSHPRCAEEVSRHGVGENIGQGSLSLSIVGGLQGVSGSTSSEVSTGQLRTLSACVDMKSWTPRSEGICFAL